MEQDRTKTKKDLFIKLFSHSRGSISEICEKVKISRETFYQWRKDPTFFESLQSIRSHLNEEVEDMLMHKIFVEKDGPSIRYFLDRKHPEYNPRKQVVEHVSTGKTFEELLYDVAERNMHTSQSSLEI